MIGTKPYWSSGIKLQIYHGPFIYNFEDIYQLLDQNNISQKIDSYEELQKFGNRS